MPATPVVLIVIAVGVGAWLLVRRNGRRNAAALAHPRSTSAPQPASIASAGAAQPGPSTPESAALARDAVFTRLHELAFGVTPLGAVPAEELAAVDARAGAVLEAVAAEPRYAPRRPLLLPQLLKAVNDSEVSRRELAGIIARDPALAGGLLKLANSSFYRVSERPVESIDRAVALLGTEGLRSLIATALVQPVFRLSATQFPQFPTVAWEHTFRMATAAEAHAAIVEDSDPFAAQLLGLTLGLGAIVVFRVALDQYGTRAPNAAAVGALLGAHTARVARSIAASWDLSGRVLAALEDQAPGNWNEPTSLGRSLSFGNLIGALAVLHANARLSDEAAKATVLAEGASLSQFERIWTRLTGRTTAKA
jgi:HD-like signal output (HDOD) protein